MKTAVYFCTCGTGISGRIDPDRVREALKRTSGISSFKTVEFICSEEGVTFLENDIAEDKPDRVVIAACSPREHELTFMKAMERAGMNPYLMQMVNIREQIAWVTPDSAEAVEKAAACIRAAVERVRLHQPLERRELEVCPDVLVVGAGPAGLKAALSLAEAGRKVTLIEKAPVIGGLPVRFEELFPDMECGPCLLEPVLGDVLHGQYAENIELHTQAELAGIVGFYGNFTATIRQKPRYADIHRCMSCGECIAQCPVTVKNTYNCGMSDKKAIDFPFAGALPNVPYIDTSVCLRFAGGNCSICKQSCPVGEDVINYEDGEKTFEISAGAVIIATGSSLYDCTRIPALGYGSVPDILTSLEFERLLSSTGPTGGNLQTSKGVPPEAVAIIHCAGSLDRNHREYCSSVCCQDAFKYSHSIADKLPEAGIFHFFKEIVVPGKEASALYRQIRNRAATVFHRYNDIANLSCEALESGRMYIHDSDTLRSAVVDMVVLCPAIVPGKQTGHLARLLDLSLDNSGFFEELNGRLDVSRSTIKGVYIAGSCQAPMDIQKAALGGVAAAGCVLAGLVKNRTLSVEPICAVVNTDRCSGCKTCIAVCPYHAISFDEAAKKAVVNALLCQGCGTCVAACPSSAMRGNHFTDEQITAELEGLLT